MWSVDPATWKLSQVTLARSMGVPSEVIPPGTAALPAIAIRLVSAENLAGTAVASSFQASTSKAGGSSPSSQPLTA